MNSYYVYELRKPTGETFYVGKGTRGRIGFHEWAAKQGMRGHLYNTIRKLGRILAVKVAERLTNEEAKKLECELIANYGRRADGGTLVNITHGGDGCEGFKHNDKSTAGMKSAWVRRKEKFQNGISEDGRERLRLAGLRKRGIKASDEMRRKLSAYLRSGNHWTKRLGNPNGVNAMHAATRKKVVVNGELFNSISEAAVRFGISSSTASYRVKHGKNRSGYGEWRYA